MRCISTNCLHVHTRKTTVRRHNGLQVGVASKIHIVGDRVVRPVDQDWGLTNTDSAGIAVNRYKVASFVELSKEVELSLGGFLTSGTGCESSRPRLQDCRLG